MKKIIIYFLALSTLTTLLAQEKTPNLTGKSFFSPRSQSVDMARELSGWHPHIYRYDKDDYYASGTITAQYSRSFRSSRLAEALFGTDILFISGSNIEERGRNDFLADYFGLSPNFVSTVKIKPHVHTAVMAFNGYIGLDGLCRGLYLRINAPLTWTRWELELQEEVNLNGLSTSFPAEYMNFTQVAPAASSFTQAVKGTTAFGQMTEPLAFGKINGSHAHCALSDLQCTLGYNIILSDLGFAGLNLRIAAPTGNRSRSRFLFEPIVGNGHHWEIGAGFLGSVLLFEKDNEQRLSFFTDITLTHLCKSKQRRSFDLQCNGLANRYMLVKEFDDSGSYTGTLVPLINKTTLDCHVSINLQVEILFMFGYTYNGFVYDIGYNGWLRSRERISHVQCIPEYRYALKGIQNVVSDSDELSAITQSSATIHGNNIANQIEVADTSSPVFITNRDINHHSAAASRALTHKLFIYFGYSWDNNDCLYPVSPL